MAAAGEVAHEVALVDHLEVGRTALEHEVHGDVGDDPLVVLLAGGEVPRDGPVAVHRPRQLGRWLETLQREPLEPGGHVDDPAGRVVIALVGRP